MRVRLVAVACLLALVGSCSSDEPPPTRVDEAGAYIAVITWAVDNAMPSADGEGRPVVYIAASDGSVIDSGIQADVARATVDDVDVRFADSPSQAVENDVDGQPVKDAGVMMIVDPLPADTGAAAEFLVKAYRTIDDVDHLAFSLLATQDGVTVSRVQARPPD